MQRAANGGSRSPTFARSPQASTSPPRRFTLAQSSSSANVANAREPAPSKYSASVATSETSGPRDLAQTRCTPQRELCKRYLVPSERRVLAVFGGSMACRKLLPALGERPVVRCGLHELVDKRRLG